MKKMIKRAGAVLAVLALAAITASAVYTAVVLNRLDHAMKTDTDLLTASMGAGQEASETLMGEQVRALREIRDALFDIHAQEVENRNRANQRVADAGCETVYYGNVTEFTAEVACLARLLVKKPIH